MKFAILTPTRNRPGMVARAVASVLAQTHHDWELILVDVSDEPIEQPDDPRIRYFRKDAEGPAKDFQFALDQATGEIIHPLADDDRLPPHALETAAQLIGNAEWLVARTVLVQNGMPVALRGGTRVSLLQTLDGQYMLGGAVYWRRSLSDRLGGFDADFDGAADFDLYTRFAQDSDPALSREIIYLYSDHPGTDSRTNPQRQADASRRVAARA